MSIFHGSGKMKNIYILEKIVKMVGQEIIEQYSGCCFVTEIWSKGSETFGIEDFGRDRFYKTRSLRYEGDTEGDTRKYYRSVKINENIDTFRDRMVQEGWTKIWEKAVNWIVN